jgi:hypothetical protein
MISAEVPTGLVPASGYTNMLAEPRYIMWHGEALFGRGMRPSPPQTQMLAMRQTHGSDFAAKEPQAPFSQKSCSRFSHNRGLISLIWIFILVARLD